MAALSPKVIDYIMISCSSLIAFNQQCKEKVGAGYQPYWKSSVTSFATSLNPLYSQAFVKYAE